MMLVMGVDITGPGVMDRLTSLEFVATMQLIDTALIAIMIRVFLEMSGEDSRTVFLGRLPLLKRNAARPGARAGDLHRRGHAWSPCFDTWRHGCTR